jgi:uncharacterized protein (TIGR03437 family)
MAGGVAIPDIPAVQSVNPSGSDDTAAIQAAINSVASLPIGSNGFRGAVALNPGTFKVSGTVSITSSGIVLRGSGSGSGGTVVNLTGQPHPFLDIHGSGAWQASGNSSAITDPFIPSGTNSFHVDNPANFHVGDTVLVRRPITAAWVQFMGMDKLVRNGVPQTWLNVGSFIRTDRVIQAVSGNQIAVDVPLTDSFDSQFLTPPGPTVIKYTFPGRITQVGVESFRITAPGLDTDITLPQWQAISIDAVMNAWVRDVAVEETENSITTGSASKQVTISRVRIDHLTPHTAGVGLPIDFAISGTQIFVDRCSSTGAGSFPLATESEVTGPIAVLGFTSNQPAGISPHQRWATGILADSAQIPNAVSASPGISYSNRGTDGTGQGWDAGWAVAWNVTSPFFLVQAPPGALNWCIGCVGKATPASDGIFDSPNVLVKPASLYLEQLRERLGASALANIGYGNRIGSAASGGPVVAPESIASFFGANLTVDTAVPAGASLPTTLAGVSLQVIDSSKVSRTAPLFYASPTQLNFEVPAGTVSGTTTFRILDANNLEVASTTATVAKIAPSIFTADGTGSGVAAAFAIQVSPDGTQIAKLIFQCTTAGCTSVPIDLSLPTVLTLYGTGVRFRSSLPTVTATIGSTSAPVLYAGAQGFFAGLDQVNVQVPASLSGAGETTLVVTVDGQAANTVRLSIK